MPSFHFLDKKSPVNLVPGNHIIHEDRFWRVIENYRLLGHPAAGNRMLVIVPEAHIDPSGYKFLEVDAYRIDTYIRKD